jgi:uncharacterized protein YjaZ
MELNFWTVSFWEKIVNAEKTKKVLMPNFSKKIKCVQKNLLGLMVNGLIIRVKKTKKV